MTSFIFHRKNVSPTEDLFVRWIHLNHRNVYLSIGVRLPVLDIYEYYGHESFYNVYAVLTAKLIEHQLPLEMSDI